MESPWHIPGCVSRYPDFSVSLFSADTSACDNHDLPLSGGNAAYWEDGTRIFVRENRMPVPRRDMELDRGLSAAMDLFPVCRRTRYRLALCLNHLQRKKKKTEQGGQ